MLSLSSSLINGTHACIFVDNYFAFPNIVMKLLDVTESIGVAIFYPIPSTTTRKWKGYRLKLWNIV